MASVPLPSGPNTGSNPGRGGVLKKILFDLIAQIYCLVGNYAKLRPVRYYSIPPAFRFSWLNTNKQENKQTDTFLIFLNFLMYAKDYASDFVVMNSKL